MESLFVGMQNNKATALQGSEVDNPLLQWEILIHLVNRLIKQVVNDFCNWSFNVDACENKIPRYYENQPMSSVQLDDKQRYMYWINIILAPWKKIKGIYSEPKNITLLIG